MQTASSSPRSCGSTRRARPPTTGTAGSCNTCCARCWAPDDRPVVTEPGQSAASRPEPASLVGGALLVGGILAISFNMRAAVTGLPPVFPEMSAAAGWSTATQSALAAVPVLSFAVFSGLAPALARRIGDERVLGGAMLLLATGLAMRSAAPGVLLFPGTVVASCA